MLKDTQNLSISVTISNLIVGLSIVTLAAARAESSVATAQQAINASRNAEKPQGSTAAGMQVIHFPTDRSMGTVFIQDADTKRQIETFFYWITNEDTNWETLGPATGDVSIPAGKRLRLIIYAEAALKDLSPLSKFRPDDLYALTIGAPFPGGLKQGDVCMSYLAGLTGLKVLDLAQTNLSSKGIKFIKNLRSLERLTLPEQITDEGLADIAELPSLKGLYFKNNRVTNDGLHHLAKLTSLEELSLGGDRINDAGLAHLSKMPNLRYLMLWGNFTDAGLAHLKNVAFLQILHLGSLERITNAGLAHLSELPNLENLCLYWADGITDDGVAQLKKMGSLRKLDIKKSQVTDKGLAHLSQIKSLEYLDLPDKGITDQGLSHLANLKGLKHLVITRSYYADPKMDKGYYTDKGLEQLAKLQFLEELSLGSRRITDAGISQIVKLTNLKELTLFGCTEVTNEALAKIGTLKHLERLTINTCPKVTVAGISYLNAIPGLVELDAQGMEQDNSILDISKLTKLEKLFLIPKTKRIGNSIVCEPVRDEDLLCLRNLKSLKNFQIGNAGEISDRGLSFLAGLTNLEILIISGPDLTDDGLKFLANMKNLGRLIIYGGKFTDKGLRHLEGLKSLTGIELQGESNFTVAGLQRLRAELPNLTLLETK